jgi:lipopolysaccharide heptosyltransferase II
MADIRKILFISLSNIGDCVLTLPVLDILREKFPYAKITVLADLRPKQIFQDNPVVDRFITYNKKSPLKEKIALLKELRQENFDIVVDLRSSLLGELTPARYKTSPFMSIPKNIIHMKDRHLYKVKGIMQKLNIGVYLNAPKHSLYISLQDENYIKNILKNKSITEQDKIVVISSGAKSHTKRWPQDKFLALSSLLIQEFKVKIVLVGDSDDIYITRYISGNSKYPIIDLAGKTTIGQLAYLLKQSSLVITNDSAVLHIAGYLNVPTVAIFGITSELKYGPWPESSLAIKKDIHCRPCEEPQCKFGNLECLDLIKVEDVLKAARNILFSTPYTSPNKNQDKFRRILVVRTDRIGDVLLSTPVIKTLRYNYPDAYIAMMVSPYSKDIVDGNPYLDKVIIYDKDGKHKSWWRSLKFSRNLKKKRFDLAIILHPTNRVHLVTFFAGIPKRIGYDLKIGFLLTNRIRHTKQYGEKHELEYNLDLVRYLGIEPEDKNLFMPIRPESEKWVEELFRQEGIKEKDKLLVIHPGASCPSKVWPNDRFAQVADRLIEKYSFKVLIVSGPKDLSLAQSLIRNMQHSAINLAGKTSVSQLASILKRSRLFISNDSGPVHVASAVGVPVISIFGRNQAGLSPKRWGPTGKNDLILHKEVGCIECLAHNCVKEFACLKAISTEDVINAAESILKT